MKVRVERSTDGRREESRRGILLTIEDLAAFLSVSVGCIRAWRLKGEGPPAIRVGSSLRWAEHDVEAWLEARRESPRESA